MDRIDSARLDASPDTHFRLYFFGAVAGLVRQAVDIFGSFEALAERFPFVTGYVNELASFGLEGVDLAQAPGAWREIVRTWEKRQSARFPLQALAEQFDLGYADLVVLLGAGLADEDMRFGALFCAMHGIEGEPRPTAGMIARWAESGRRDGDLSAVRRLLDLGILEATNPDAPAAAWRTRMPALLLGALRGHCPETLAPGVRYRAAEQLPRLDALLLPDQVRQTADRLLELIAGAQLDTVIVRGPRSNGRRTLLRALARAQGRGVIEVSAMGQAPSSTLRPVCALAGLLDAVPVFAFDSAPGESVDFPEMNARLPWAGAVLGTAGGMRGLGERKAALLALGVPDVSTRRRLWSLTTPSLSDPEARALAGQFRMTTGAIVQMARAAGTQARLNGSAVFGPRDLAKARDTIDRGDLETLATRVPAAQGWHQLVTGHDTWSELQVLEQRCRHREALAAGGGAAPTASGCGVKALMKGPSGCGKTLAARVLASALDNMDLYRVDLSAVVDKYIGETEKRLNRLFDRAEETDAILLFDEGDALFGRRTGLHNSNDRYANLQTNFLLQRLESHDGIVLVTTNLGEAIDRAFQRRMDVVVEFGHPDAEQRLAIWWLHVPQDHRVAGTFLEEVAYRCSLSGGQIRNAASHAALLALSSGVPVGDEHIAAGVAREYRKAGGLSPLRADAMVA